MRPRRLGYDGLCLQLAAGGSKSQRRGAGLFEVKLRVRRREHLMGAYASQGEDVAIPEVGRVSLDTNVSARRTADCRVA